MKPGTINTVKTAAGLLLCVAAVSAPALAPVVALVLARTAG
ncbi:hypothetical protein ACFC09_06380 [Streptomyces sp. NPDC056161]